MLHFKRQKFNNPEPLEKTDEQTIISNLGQVAEGITSRFSCGGKLEMLPNDNVSLAYKSVLPQDTQQHSDSSQLLAASEGTKVIWDSIEFPVQNKAAMSKLLDACAIASFGYKGESVIDKNYRDAFKLDTKDFMTNFQLCGTSILRDIESIMPNCAGLQAELYKLNIYAPGGFFKPHVDTPRSGQMFGSLVVCLPTQFSGGALVVRHKKEVMKYDWSLPISDPFNGLQWAAFFSDIEHEVLPVTEGYRVTLTYNLYYGTNPSRSLINIKTNPFYRTLQAALSNPIFMRDGGILGFNTHYSYTFDKQWADIFIDTNFTGAKFEIISKLEQWPIKQFIGKSRAKQLSHLRELGIIDTDAEKVMNTISQSTLVETLKGSDYVVYSAAKLLGLHVHVKPLLANELDKPRGKKFALKNDLDDFRWNEDFEYGPYDDKGLIKLYSKNVCQFRGEDITWCQQPKYDQPSGAIGCYGNEPTLLIWYKAAVILIGIPKWDEYRQQLVAIGVARQESTELQLNQIDDNVEACFKDLELNN
ncbi:uncharacterized protein [Dysidea avara]|uniref:uncharacterized protein n=1 Tax=Dysidea avara TaxID=196820 RepID=UPI0033325A2F